MTEDGRQALEGFFDGRDLERKQGLATYLLTVGEDGWPHAAMVSVGEVLLDQESGVRLATWTRSRTTANLRRTGRAVLLVVLDGRALRVRLSLAPSQGRSERGGLTCFVGAVEAVEQDVAPYAVLLDGVRFTLNEPDVVLQRWRETLELLRSQPASAPSTPGAEPGPPSPVR